MKHITKTIKVFDIFGSLITFRHDNQTKYKTCGGGCATILSAGFVIFLLHYFSYDCINKINPIVRSNIVYKADNTVNMTNYFWAFYFTDEEFNLLDEPDRYLAFHGKITVWTDKLEQRTLTFSKCNLKKHFSNTSFSRQKIFEVIPYFYDSYCLDLEEKFNLFNGYSQIPRASLEIFVMECYNMTLHGVDCNLC
jgi:hypothetical protein